MAMVSRPNGDLMRLMEENKTKIPAIIVDIDGTLCDTEHRVHFLRGKKKDWMAFYAASDLDKPRYDVIAQVQKYYDEGYQIILVSGRPEEYRGKTKDWFGRLESGPPFANCELFMRKDGDYRADTITKKEIFDEHIKDKYSVACAFDDRPAVIRMWEENGIEVIDVGEGIEF